MYKDAQDDNDNKNIVSEENTLTIKCLKAFSKTDEAVDYFWNHGPLYDSSNKAEC
jgi:hypothetical protein